MYSINKNIILVIAHLLIKSIVMLKMSLTIHLQDYLYQVHLQDKFFCPPTKPPYGKVRT